MARCSILAVIVWVVGLMTAVPLAVWHLLFHAPREQYALLITFIIGWPFLYWPTVGPILMLVKLRSVYRGLRQVRSGAELRRKLAEGETEDVIIDFIARENRIPKFLARRAYRYILRLLATSDQQKPIPIEARPQEIHTADMQNGACPSDLSESPILQRENSG